MMMVMMMMMMMRQIQNDVAVAGNLSLIISLYKNTFSLSPRRYNSESDDPTSLL